MVNSTTSNRHHIHDKYELAHATAAYGGASAPTRMRWHATSKRYLLLASFFSVASCTANNILLQQSRRVKEVSVKAWW